VPGPCARDLDHRAREEADADAADLVVGQPEPGPASPPASTTSSPSHYEIVKRWVREARRQEQA
jgi:hypothetical protein